jgi:hypothetical protein
MLEPLSALKMRKDIGPVKPCYGKDKLVKLRRQCEEWQKESAERMKAMGGGRITPGVGEVLGGGCILIIIAAVIVGLYHIGVWINVLIRNLVR